MSVHRPAQTHGPSANRPAFASRSRTTNDGTAFPNLRSWASRRRSFRISRLGRLDGGGHVGDGPEGHHLPVPDPTGVPVALHHGVVGPALGLALADEHMRLCRSTSETIMPWATSSSGEGW